MPAAGMLAPRAEGLESGPMLDLCLASLTLYPDWVAKLEALTGQTVGYWPNGILAPRFTRPARHGPTQGWLSAEALQSYQPGLGDTVQGGLLVSRRGPGRQPGSGSGPPPCGTRPGSHYP